MAFRINYNYLASFTLTQLHNTENKLNKVVTQLSSGRRIVTAADDVSGYNIVQRLTRVSKGIEQGIMNSQDGMSLAQVALSATQQMIDNYQTVRQKALQAANETVNPQERKQIGIEIAKIIEAMDRLAQQVDFNEFKLFQSANLSANGVHHNSFGYTVEEDEFNKISQIIQYVGSTVLSYSNGSAERKVSALHIKIYGKDYYLIKHDAFSTIDSDIKGAKSFVVAGSLLNDGFTSADLTMSGFSHIASIVVNSNNFTASVFANVYSYNSNYTQVSGKITSSDINHFDELKNINYSDFKTLSNFINKNSIAIKDSAGINIKLYADTYQFMVQYGPEAAAAKTSFGANGAGDNRIFVATFTENVFSNVLRLKIKDKNYQEIAEQLFSKYGFGSGATESKILDFANKVGQLINILSDRAADLGSTINQLQSIVNFNEQAKTTIDESTSRIRDVDFAKATAKFQKLQILMQSGTAMLAQANQLPQYALRLVG